MFINRDFKELLRFLNQEKVEYLIVGAHAVIFYTEPRYTKDIDIWIRPEAGNANRVYQALKKFGAPVKEVTPEDFANSEMMYQIGLEPNRIDILMGVDGITFSSAWKNKKVSKYGDEKIYLLCLKDLMRSKRASKRPQDLLDLDKLKKSAQGNQRK